MDEYAPIYAQNIYTVMLSSTESFTFSLQHITPHILFNTPFSIITAWNPNNTELSIEENHLRNQELYSSLHSSYELFEAKGCFEEHCEDGYLIVGIDLDDAIALGRKYEQFAIFYNDTTSLRYIACEDEHVIVERRVEV